MVTTLQYCVMQYHIVLHYITLHYTADLLCNKLESLVLSYPLVCFTQNRIERFATSTIVCQGVGRHSKGSYPHLCVCVCVCVYARTSMLKLKVNCAPVWDKVKV